MRALWLVVLVISILGNLVGGYLLYKVFRLRAEVQTFKRYNQDLAGRYEALKNDYPGTSEFLEANRQLLYETTPEQRRQMTVLYGASITAGWKIDGVFPDGRIINRGVGSQSNTQLLSRFSADVLRLEPGQVVIKFCSGNFRPGLDEEMMWDEFETLATMAHNRGIRPLPATVIPLTRAAETYPGYRIVDRIIAFNNRIREFAEAKGWPLVDYFGAMADVDGYLPDSMARDPIHPNDSGYAVMAEVLKPLVP